MPAQELQHALTIAKHIDYLGGTPTTVRPAGRSRRAKPAPCSELISKTRTTPFAHYRERVKECEALAEFAIAEDIREILRQEQEHQIDLATALGEDVPDVSSRRR